MRTPLHGIGFPFELPSNVIYFHDWRYVNHGGYRWVDSKGAGRGLFVLEELPVLQYQYQDIPLGIRLVAKPATKTGPVFTPEKANEMYIFGGNIIHDNGVYRLWYDCWPREHIGSPEMGNYNLVRYAESDDGTNWRLPKVGMIEHGGNKDNNIVYGGPLTEGTGYHGGSVFKDPSAPSEERYKAFHLGHLSRERYEKYKKERPDDIDPMAVGEKSAWALFGAVSPDGFKWKQLPEPFIVQNSDTHNIGTYDVARKKYVGYIRTWYMRRRTIGITQSDDFRRFSFPEELIWPDATQNPYDLWYANAKTMMPGTIDYHVMFPMRWSLIDDRFEFCLATSPDGIVWGFVPGGPVCKPGNAGEWDGGVTAPGLGLVNLPGDRIGIPFCGSAVPHKHPRRPPLGALGWATWDKERLVALEAETEGSFATWPVVFKGRNIHLNFRTAFAGYVKVEALDSDWNVLPGRSFADCDYMSGNCLDKTVTWKGNSDLGHNENSPVILRLKLRTAELYAVRFC